MTFFTWRLFSNSPMPKSSTPALLPTMVRPLTPLSTSAWMRFSGMPHRPKPPAAIVMLSRRSPCSAADAFAWTFFIGVELPERRHSIIHHGTRIDAVRRGGRRRRPGGPRGGDSPQAALGGNLRLPDRKRLRNRRAHPLWRRHGPARAERADAGLEGKGRAVECASFRG